MIPLAQMKTSFSQYLKQLQLFTPGAKAGTDRPPTDRKQTMNKNLLDDLFIEVELVVGQLEGIVPIKELLPGCWFHAGGPILMMIRKGSHISLIGLGVEEMGEVSLLEFRKIKGVRNGSQGHGEKVQSVLDGDPIGGQGHDLCSFGNMVEAVAVVIEIGQQKLSIVPLKQAEENVNIAKVGEQPDKMLPLSYGPGQ